MQASTWKGVMENPSDLKELIPEFYEPSRAARACLHTEGGRGEVRSVIYNTRLEQYDIHVFV